ncbi:MAG: proton-conducting transporter membrane subunit, partial [Gammaproteobacteria bacterium]|nr:proton-conducting transporter membrane subunit [Gammaproteobacteria bacterium]
GQWRFDLFSLSELNIQQPMQNWIFFLLFYGLAVRIPIFPLHGWLPLVIQRGSVAIAPIFLLGLKTGVYGLLRFVFPLFADSVIIWQKYIIAFAVVGIFYAALLAMQQDKLRGMLAYAVVSHTSILLIGLFSLSDIAFQGAIILTINFGLAISVLFLMTGLVYRRTNTTTLSKLGNLFDRIPIIAIGFFVGGVAIVGMPGTPGFDAVHLVLESSIERNGALVTIAAAIGNVLAAGFLLLAFQRAFLAPQQATAKPLEVEPTQVVERVIAGLLILIVLSIGFYSEPWMALVEQSANTLSLPYLNQLANGH